MWRRVFACENGSIRLKPEYPGGDVQANTHLIQIIGAENKIVGPGDETLTDGPRIRAESAQDIGSVQLRAFSDSVKNSTHSKKSACQSTRARHGPAAAQRSPGRIVIIGDRAHIPRPGALIMTVHCGTDTAPRQSRCLVHLSRGAPSFEKMFTIPRSFPDTTIDSGRFIPGCQFGSIRSLLPFRVPVQPCQPGRNAESPDQKYRCISAPPAPGPNTHGHRCN